MKTKNMLLELRKKHGLSQNDMAEKLFVTRQAVSSWETSDTVPNPETLKSISELFGVPINTLLGQPMVADAAAVEEIIEICAPYMGMSSLNDAREFVRMQLAARASGGGTIISALEMIRDLNEPLPGITVPEGYTIVSVNENNGHLWEEAMDASWGDYSPGTFRYVLVDNNGYEENRVFALLDENGRAVATASAWDYAKGDWYGETYPMVIFVGVIPSCQKQNLGELMITCALRELKKRGNTKARLVVMQTEDRSVNDPALMTYLNCGFVPHITDQKHDEAWRKAFVHLGIPAPAFSYKNLDIPSIDIPQPSRPWPYQVRCATEAQAAGDTYIFGKWDRHNLYLVDPDRYIQLQPLLAQSDSYNTIVTWILEKQVKAIYIDRPRNPQALLLIKEDHSYCRVGVSADERFGRGVETYLRSIL